MRPTNSKKMGYKKLGSFRKILGFHISSHLKQVPVHARRVTRQLSKAIFFTKALSLLEQHGGGHFGYYSLKAPSQVIESY